ncbi:MAG: hypothetical protein AAGM67_11530, partial [Bacteroidota bacterium]
MSKTTHLARNLLLGFGLLLLFGIPFHLKAQSSLGLIRSFLPEEYSGEDFVAGPQNWGMVQNQQNLLFISNNNGVLSFDGEEWQIVEGTRGRSSMKMGSSPKGIVYLADDTDLGRIVADSLGKLQFRSLRALLPDSSLNHEVLRIKQWKGQVVFQTRQSLLFWEEESRQFRVWDSPQPILYALIDDSELLLWLRDEGLYAYEEAQLSPRAQIAQLPDNIAAILPSQKASEWILVSKGKGLFRIQSQTITPLIEAWSSLKVRSAVRLQDGSIG